MSADLANGNQLDLFVLAGQSNMQGWKSNGRDYPEDPEGLDSHVKFYWNSPGISSSGGNWVGLQSQAGLFPGGHFGPEVSFTRELKGAGYNPAIFKFSLGGTSLGRDWGAVGDGGLYDQMVMELEKAKTKLSSEGYTVVPRAFVWVQGESDATRWLANGYSQRLEKLIVDMRNRVLNSAHLPVILGIDEQHPDVRSYPEVVSAQQNLAASDPDTVFTSMHGLEKSDSTHLTSGGVNQHGVRLFNAYMGLVRMETQNSYSPGAGRQ